jgi:hypothetical protein
VCLSLLQQALGPKPGCTGAAYRTVYIDPQIRARASGAAGAFVNVSLCVDGGSEREQTRPAGCIEAQGQTNTRRSAAAVQLARASPLIER